MMKLFLLATVVAVAGATECRKASGMDDKCDLELVPGEKVLTLTGLTKFCGMMYASYVYASHYDKVGENVAKFCAAENESKCCPTNTLGFLQVKDPDTSCTANTVAGANSCDTVNKGMPASSGTYQSFYKYSTNIAGSKPFKAYMGCDTFCGPAIKKGLEAYVKGSGDDDAVAMLTKEFVGDATVPSIFPKQNVMGGKMYPGTCYSTKANENVALEQKILCECRLKSTVKDKRPAFCAIDFAADKPDILFGAATSVAPTAALALLAAAALALHL